MQAERAELPLNLDLNNISGTGLAIMHRWLTPLLAQYLPAPHESMRSGGALEPVDPLWAMMELVLLAMFVALPILIILGTKHGQSRREEEFDELEQLAMKFKHPRPRHTDEDKPKKQDIGEEKNEDQHRIALREDPYGW